MAYYLDSLTWGLGWAGIAAALAGAVLVLRRDLVRGLILVALPLALFAYLALQSRYFGRWLLPAYPALAMLAAVAWCGRRSWSPRRGRAGGRGAPALALVVLAQPLRRRRAHAPGCSAARTRSARRAPSSTSATRRGCACRSSPRCPGRYFRSNPEGTPPAWLARCPRRDGWTEPGWSYLAAGGRRVCAQYKPGLFVRPDGGVRASAYHVCSAPR